MIEITRLTKTGGAVLQAGGRRFDPGHVHQISFVKSYFLETTGVSSELVLP